MYVFVCMCGSLWIAEQGIVIPLKLGIQRGVAGGLGMGISQGVLYCAYALSFWFGYVSLPGILRPMVREVVPSRPRTRVSHYCCWCRSCSDVHLRVCLSMCLRIYHAAATSLGMERRTLK